MKHLFITAIAAVSLCGCFGYGSSDNEMTGQIKYVENETPIICPDRFRVDVSAGVMVNGSGSMSKADYTFTVLDAATLARLKFYAAHGTNVRIRYDEQRVKDFCKVSGDIITSVDQL